MFFQTKGTKYFKVLKILCELLINVGRNKICDGFSQSILKINMPKIGTKHLEPYFKMFNLKAQFGGMVLFWTVDQH